MPPAARSPSTRLTSAARIGPLRASLLCLLTSASAAAAYTQNVQLERELDRSDPKALALLPAKGYADGVAGFFRVHGLYVAPGSQRAWCADRMLGILKPGCYIEFSVQGNGFRASDDQGIPCGHSGRWYRAPGAKRYVATPGPFISNAMANGEWQQVESAIYEEPPAERLPARACGLIDDRTTR